MSTTVNGTTGVTFPDGTNQNTSASGFGFKNRIINGAFMIDQRNAGASVTINTATNIYTIDRWRGYGTSSAGVFTIQRSTSVPPFGFTNFLRATVTTTDSSLSATDFYAFSQPIEGLNIADLAWGSVNAQTVTLSFWVRSSLTGTFTGSINANPASSASYVFTYTINSANTWEYKTVTISGPTSGTFPTDNTTGFSVWYSLALGSDSTTSTVGSWQAAAKWGSSSAVNVMATLNATLDITGVQLEKGSTATSFDYRPYGTELMLCQRYYENVRAGYVGSAVNGAANGFVGRYIVEKRTAPTITWLSNVSSLNFPTTAPLGPYLTTTARDFYYYRVGSATTQDGRYEDNYSASAEL